MRYLDLSSNLLSSEVPAGITNVSSYLTYLLGLSFPLFFPLLLLLTHPTFSITATCLGTDLLETSLCPSEALVIFPTCWSSSLFNSPSITKSFSPVTFLIIPSLATSLLNMGTAKLLTWILVITISMVISQMNWKPWASILCIFFFSLLFFVPFLTGSLQLGRWKHLLWGSPRLDL